METGRVHLSATVSSSTYNELEEARKRDGRARSTVVDEAIKTWLRLRDERLMKEACIREAEEHRNMAISAKKMASRVPLG